MPNPIISAKLEFLSTAITGIAANYAMDGMTDDEALQGVQDVLEEFIKPVGNDVRHDDPT